MAKERGTWRTGGLLAYTDREGPGRPPAASPTWVTGTLVGILGVTFVGMLSSDSLCPEHRAWVEALGSVAFVGIVAAVIGLWRGWAVAPLITMGSSALGISIGLIDAAHDPTRGALVAVAFAIATGFAALASWRVLQLERWDRAARRRAAAEAEDRELVDNVRRSSRTMSTGSRATELDELSRAHRTDT